MTAKSRYDALTSYRAQFLDTAVECSRLTLPYLIRQDDDGRNTSRNLPTPWQSVGAKGVVTLASKLMLALLPPQTSFFKLQLDDSKLGEDFPPEARSEIDLSLAKQERRVMESIAASSDRVVVHQAIKHLVVAGNGLLYMGDQLKFYPLNRYVVERDGNGNWTEIVSKERISRKLLPPELMLAEGQPVRDDGETSGQDQDIDIYTHVRRKGTQVIWHQEVFDKILPDSMGKAPLESNPWLPLRFNTVDGEAFGRGRVEEFLGDLRSLEGLMQALVEGSAVAAKVIFLVNPGSTTKAASISAAPNGAIIQGRAEDVTVVQVGKSIDFSTAAEMSSTLERRISEAFLVMNVRNSERTTAEEVRMTQMELEQQLGGLFSLLTVEFLVPYLNRKLSTLQKKGEVLRLPRKLVKPTIVAGVNALGRGQDRESLTQFLTTLQQTFGPEVMMKFLNPDEAVKRLAAAQGIDVLNLVKSVQEMQGEKEQEMQEQAGLIEMQNKPNMLKAPMFDPSKNPQAMEMIENEQASAQQSQASAQAEAAPGE
jgi:hypothetical protein